MRIRKYNHRIKANPERATAGRRQMSPGARHRLLVITSVLGVLTVVHDADHVRQGRALPGVLYGVAVVSLPMIGTTLTLLVRRHALAQPVAFAQGLATILGVGAVHVAPQWSAFTDSYSAAHVDGLSWAIVVAVMPAGLVLAVAAASQASGPRGG